MTRSTHSRLTELDLMMIRAGGRSAAEFEALAAAGFGLAFRCRICGVLADALYRAVLLLEAGARRSAGASHRRLAGVRTA